jgi:archaellum component FlaC
MNKILQPRKYVGNYFPVTNVDLNLVIDKINEFEALIPMLELTIQENKNEIERLNNKIIELESKYNDLSNKKQIKTQLKEND